MAQVPSRTKDKEHQERVKQAHAKGEIRAQQIKAAAALNKAFGFGFKKPGMLKGLSKAKAKAAVKPEPRDDAANVALGVGGDGERAGSGSVAPGGLGVEIGGEANDGAGLGGGAGGGLLIGQGDVMPMDMSLMVVGVDGGLPLGRGGIAGQGSVGMGVAGGKRGDDLAVLEVRDLVAAMERDPVHCNSQRLYRLYHEMWPA